MKTIVLGRTYRDRITGFQGIATGHVDYITGCNQTLLAPPAKGDGTLVPSEWFDDQRLEDQQREPITLDNGAAPGFDRAPPKR